MARQEIEQRWDRKDPTIKARPCLKCGKIVKQPVEWRNCPSCRYYLLGERDDDSRESAPDNASDEKGTSEIPQSA